MTENLLQKLEDKVVALLSEMELLRNELKQVKHENFALKNEKVNSIQKLQGMMALLDTVEIEQQFIMTNNVNELSENYAPVGSPVSQLREEFASV